MTADHCQHCGADVSNQPQFACETYDHIEIPPIKTGGQRITLYGGVSVLREKVQGGAAYR